MTELKPCPFCGGKAKLHNEVFAEFCVKVFYVQCTNCGVRTMKDGFTEYAVKDWNRRVNNG